MSVQCAKFNPRQKTPLVPTETIKVFPNYRHLNRKDGLGVPSLSPMTLGPVNHGQPGLPPAKLIENYHHANKVFENEVDMDGNPLPIFFETQKQWYNDDVPHRHKYRNKKTLYSLHYSESGELRRYQYVESRYFYCHWYEILAKKQSAFVQLRTMLADGKSLLILGYDGRKIDKSLKKMYEDDSKPFGHELVLCSLLIIKDPEDYPWNVYYREHKELYC